MSIRNLHLLISISNKKYKVLPNYIEYEKFINNNDKSNFRKELGIINRRLAKISDTVVECAYGNIIYHKDKTI